MKASFVIFLDPSPKRLPVKLAVPALSPSKIGGLSIDNCIDTLGSLWFSTTNTFNPLLRLKDCGSPKLISGAGPGVGITERSTCACRVIAENNVKNNIYVVFIVIFSLQYFVQVNILILTFG